MSAPTTLLPFQPASMSTAQLAAVSYLARYSGRTHSLYAYQLKQWFNHRSGDRDGRHRDRRGVQRRVERRHRLLPASRRPHRAARPRHSQLPGRRTVRHAARRRRRRHHRPRMGTARALPGQRNRPDRRHPAGVPRPPAPSPATGHRTVRPANRRSEVVPQDEPLPEHVLPCR